MVFKKAESKKKSGIPPKSGRLTSLDNIQNYSQPKASFKQMKTQQIKNSWQKTESLNLEKDTQKLRQLINVLNDHNRDMSKTTPQTEGQLVTGKAAANVFAKEYQVKSAVNLRQQNIRKVRQETQTPKSEPTLTVDL